MTSHQFRRLALGFQGAEESAHQGHPDFRIKGKVFATLGYPDDGHGMIKISPELQAELMQAEPEVYVPAAGAWGRKGSTCVLLKKATVKSVRSAMSAAVFG
jgi:YjbR protein